MQDDVGQTGFQRDAALGVNWVPDVGALGVDVRRLRIDGQLDGPEQRGVVARGFGQRRGGFELLVRAVEPGAARDSAAVHRRDQRAGGVAHRVALAGEHARRELAHRDRAPLAGDDVAFADWPLEADIDPGVDAAPHQLQVEFEVGPEAAVPLEAEDHAGMADQTAGAGVVHVALVEVGHAGGERGDRAGVDIEALGDGVAADIGGHGEVKDGGFGGHRAAPVRRRGGRRGWVSHRPRRGRSGPSAALRRAGGGGSDRSCRSASRAGSAPSAGCDRAG